MKTLLLAVFIPALLCAQAQVPASVQVTIQIDGVTFTVPLTPAAKAALAKEVEVRQTVTVTNGVAVTTPTYSSIAELLIRHVQSTLVKPLIKQYGTDQSLASAQAALDAALATAAEGTITVH